MGDALCVCGHVQFDHIYEEGACRPGFVCSCDYFTEAVRGQLTIDDALADVIPSRRTDPGTSHAAAREIKVKAFSQRWHLLMEFAMRGEAGLTDEQAMNRTNAVSPFSEYAKRCSELRDGGYIEPTGETRIGSSGKARIVSRITEKGRTWIGQSNHA